MNERQRQQSEVPGCVRVRLRKLRLDHNLTQNQLAEKLHLSGQTISGYESGAIVPPVVTILSYADYFKVDTNYLMGWKSSPAPDDLQLSVAERQMILAYRKLSHPLQRIAREICHLESEYLLQPGETGSDQAAVINEKKGNYQK